MIVYSDELCHWAKGSTRKDHKYLKREWKNGHWVYTYPYKKSLSDYLGINQSRALREHESQVKRYGGISGMYKRQSELYDTMLSEARTANSIKSDLASLDKSNDVLKSVKKLSLNRKYNEAVNKSKNAEQKLKETNDWIVKHYELQRKYDATFLGKVSDQINRGKSWIKQRVG